MAAQAASNPPIEVENAASGGIDGSEANKHINGNTTNSTPEDFAASILAKYAQEREKRLRPQGQAQYVQLSKSDKFNHLAKDCWADQDKSPRLPLKDAMHTKIFIVGAGFGGLLYAVRLVQAGVEPEDIVLADSAGGYGGTWYWNRYPGLMCDVESYIYLPLLEETGYVPKHKYSYGSEIRQYIDLIAQKWNLGNRGAFLQSVQQLDWDETNQQWQIQTQDLADNKTVKLTSDFVILTPGLLHKPKINEFQGMDSFRGRLFHTSRWDYDYTGGSPSDPTLSKLQGKRVGIVGTGATAIQAVPHLAAHAKELYVFQRTPSSVDRRDQRPTDPAQFAASVSTRPGWQRTRNKNFNEFLNHVTPVPETNLVDDGWSNFPSYTALLGGPKPVTLDDLPSHISSLHELDLPRSERVRARVDEIVSDPTTASSLKAWYPGWCKRPCFHDDYLPTFNLPHVHLIDTSGEGISHLTPTGIVANTTTIDNNKNNENNSNSTTTEKTEYELDCIVLSTGYELEGRVSPSYRAGITTLGRNKLNLETKWASDDVATLHGLLTHGFPNLFFSGPAQATASANFVACLDQLALHAAYIITTALHSLRQTSTSTTTTTSTTTAATNGKSSTDPSSPPPSSKKVIIEPTLQAEKDWTNQILSRALTFAGVAGCTPSYINGEGDADRMETSERMRSGKLAMWGGGFEEFVDVLERWRGEGGMVGLDVVAAVV